MGYINDNRSVHDFCNIYSERDYNQSRIKWIDKQFFDSIFSDRPECLTCKLHLENIPPLCYNPIDCKFKTHIVQERDNKSGKTKGRVNIELKTSHGLSIHIGRTQLVWNYLMDEMGYHFIYRPGNDLGFHIHHCNCDEYDDRPENLAMLSIENHRLITSKINSLKAELVKLNYEIISIQEKGKMGKTIKKQWEDEYSTMEYKIEVINHINFQLDYLKRVTMDQESIDELNRAKKCVEKNIIYEPPGITDRINRYSENGTEIRKREFPRKRKGIIYTF